MIYVRRDTEIIPPKLLAVAARAQEKLSTLNEVDRREFIKKKSHVWRSFSCHLSKMSYGKCWYSESPDPQSFFDVDHFRPKLEARRSDAEVDNPGYEWLAFSWENFRYAANCSNRLRENIESGAVDGKGSWFPLLPGSVKASWDNRCELEERPVLLDPVNIEDVKLIDVQDDGRMGSSRLAIGTSQHRVTRSCELYGLNLPQIKAARLRVMREVQGMINVLGKMLDAASGADAPAAIVDNLPVKEQCNLIREKTSQRSPYSKAVRAVLHRNGFAELCIAPEEVGA